MSIIQYLEDGKTGNQPLSTNLYTELQEDVLTGKLKPGEKLTEQKICNEYKVSRTPVREALRQLEMDGLIENIPNRGAFVLGLSTQDLEDMFTLRKDYEIQAVRWAIERITEEEMQELEETFEFMEFYTMKNDINKMININTAFHQIIYMATHNRMLKQILSSYQTYLKHCSPSNYYAPSYLNDVLLEHRTIFEAFKAGDIEGGALAMKEHMENGKKRKFK
ncbi:GntR family transcriptional regulator [Anaerotruncus sp. 80]|uniref:GntR family transcriptional regulator n=1 Tax=Anaerotruncus colihominis TaxID=169435 RepID=A0A845QIC0_9FIRM|nr:MULTISPECIES: GntR family transcriptional regulator [Anaerotruncus]MCI9638897.1 GntR family transcriptional regulator [Emergencia sp.]NBH61902.1 GntR family transcriptional regulator [Anaerotruncus colihominis]NCF02557.1 GntR family transcriptional regulator [Anaerotruncus sp. 80]